MKNFNLFSVASLLAISLFLSSCNTEEVSTELQELDELNLVNAKSQGLTASRVLPFNNNSGNRSLVSIIVEGDNLILEARRDLFFGGNRETFNFFNVTINGEAVSNRNFRGTIFQEGSEAVTRWTFSNVPVEINSVSADFRYRLVRRFRPSSRPTVVAVSSTNFSLSATAE